MTTGSRQSVRAFTLVELLVVITLITGFIVLLVPAAARIFESVSYSSAVNSVSAALGNARTLAMRNGSHTAVAFFYNVDTDEFTLQILEEASRGTGGRLTSIQTPMSNGASAAVYVPARGSVPVTLPEGIGVFGLSFLSASVEVDNGTSGWYLGDSYIGPDGETRYPWVFPRNDARLFVDPTDDPDGDPWFRFDALGNRSLDIDEFAVRQAMTFCIQFTPSGSTSNFFTVGQPNLPDAYLEYPDLPFDQAQALDPTDPDAQPTPYDQPTLFDPEAIAGAAQGTTNPEVRLRTASQLAIVDLRRLSEETGVAEPWAMRSETSLSEVAAWPPLLDELGDQITGAMQDELVEEMSAWIDLNAEIITFNRYTGNVLRK